MSVLVSKRSHSRMRNNSVRSNRRQVNQAKHKGHVQFSQWSQVWTSLTYISSIQPKQIEHILCGKKSHFQILRDNLPNDGTTHDIHVPLLAPHDLKLQRGRVGVGKWVVDFTLKLVTLEEEGRKIFKLFFCVL